MAEQIVPVGTVSVVPHQPDERQQFSKALAYLNSTLNSHLMNFKTLGGDDVPDLSVDLSPLKTHILSSMKNSEERKYIKGVTSNLLKLINEIETTSDDLSVGRLRILLQLSSINSFTDKERPTKQLQIKITEFIAELNELHTEYTDLKTDRSSSVSLVKEDVLPRIIDNAIKVGRNSIFSQYLDEVFKVKAGETAVSLTQSIATELLSSEGLSVVAKVMVAENCEALIALLDKLPTLPYFEFDPYGERMTHQLVRFAKSITFFESALDEIRKTADGSDTNKSDLLNFQSSAGESCVHLAVTLGKTDILRHCCSIPGVDLGLANNRLNTPLHFAAQTGRIEAVFALLKYTKSEGVPENCQDKNAARSLLIKTNQDGKTPLQVAKSIHTKESSFYKSFDDACQVIKKK
ncbi:hypothetical protein JQC92_17805 [Shewanella sp. 202IG2-18]|uniref:ankyrin repeat domain-containing protein n=1 Tax=Parashewanella hymeniacidonis TaxID=2807618 RepID=UPI00195FAF13|nr:ankyrin repeat domain-containing protein [Parashewanella hymeniacidonis]MBM7073866.1 hypothetical protein [Parashewanella hymeniacidonis]